MKHCISAFVLLFTFNVFAQQGMDNAYTDNSYTNNNEIRLNGLVLLASPALNLSYERILNTSSGYGISLFVDFGDDVYDEDFSITPFYRFYFLNETDFGASGLFGEVFTSFTSGKNDNFIGPSSDDEFFDISIGLGGGKKWVNQNGFSFELGAGIGRYLLDNSREDVNVNLSISIGKRF